MKRKKELFELISAMRSSEKAFFTKSKEIRNDSEEKYMILYRMIADEGIQDENVLEKRIDRIKKPGSYSATKNYLQTKLLESLVNQHIGKKEIGKCNRHLEKAEILQLKDLESLCRRELKKARTAARKIEYLEGLIKANLIERRLVKRYQNKKIAVQMEKLLAEYYTLRAKKNIEEEIEQVYDQVAPYLRTMTFAKTEALMSVLKNFLADYNDLTTEVFPTFRAYRMHVQIKQFYCHVQRDYRAEFTLHQKLRAEWKKRGDHVDEWPHYYRTALCNYLHTASLVGETSEFPEILEELAGLPVLSKYDRIEDQSVRLFYGHLYAYINHQLKEADQLSTLVKQFLNANQGNIPDSTHLAFLSNVMLTDFLLERFHDALQTVEKIEDFTPTQHREDLLGLSKIFKSICLLEKSSAADQEYVGSVARAALNWYHNHQIRTEFISLVLHSIDRMSKQNRTDWPAELDKLKAKMDHEIDLNSTDGANEVYIWIQSRLQNKSIRKLLETT